MKIYRTNYDSFSRLITQFFSDNLIGPWKIRSIGLLSLLFGYYLASTISAYFLEVLRQRVLVVVGLLIFIELTIRARDLINLTKKRIILCILDNLRIGITYSVVLEAFKLGS